MEGGPSERSAAAPAISAEPTHRIFGTSFPDVDFVRRSAAAAEVDNLPEAAAEMASYAVRAFLLRVIRDSSRFAAHSRRFRLIAQDVDAALVDLDEQPVYGMESRTFGAPLGFAGSAGKEMLVRDEGEIELAPIINAPPPKMPLEPALKTHWLVIDGEQPAVPENPLPENTADPLKTEAAESSNGANQANRNTQNGKKAEQQVLAKTIATNTLSLELQVFFKEVTEAVVGKDSTARNEALHCLRTDRGLQPMLPRFSLMLVEGVRCNIATFNVDALKRLMQLFEALLNNPVLDLQRCLHEMLPAVLSCCLSRRLSPRPDVDSHWSLREHSARIIAEICKKYTAGLLRTRVTRILSQVWTDSSKRTMTTMYAAVFCLNELGGETVRVVVVPRVHRMKEMIEKALEVEATDEEDEQKAKELREERKASKRLDELLTAILVNYVRTQRPAGLRDLSDYTEAFGGFGEAVSRVAATEMPLRSTAPPPPTLQPQQTRQTIVLNRSQSGYGSSGMRGGPSVVFRRQPASSLTGSPSMLRPVMQSQQRQQQQMASRAQQRMPYSDYHD